MTQNTLIADCPFCEGDVDGCCFCDHSGKIKVGPNMVFQSTNDLEPFQKPAPTESDLRKLYERGAFNNLTGKRVKP
jgi:hypothetical protein